MVLILGHIRIKVYFLWPKNSKCNVADRSSIFNSIARFAKGNNSISYSNCKIKKKVSSKVSI